MSTVSSMASLRTAARAFAIAASALMLVGCQHTSQDVTAGVPDDYRLRHPIAIQEGIQTTEIFVGTARGGLSAAQRADVVSVAQSWLREGTGTVTIDVPVQTPNARPATDSYREIHALLVAAGVPPRALVTRNYRPDDPRLFATIRLNYPRIAATAGPCGVWPEDLGPSIKDKGYLDNKPYYNLGCAHQRNLAAMIDNPSDLVQPRPETPAYTAKRTASFEKYRKLNASGVTYSDGEKAKLSDLGK